MSFDEGVGINGAVEYRGGQSTLGLGLVNGTGTSYFKWQWKSQRWFGEFTVKEQALG
ncbi:MAG: hypothetical protein L7U67_08450 [Schleiferiaceae bacterium]|nr:hypothetical protein [Schleiferiaceae bacterium]